MPLMEVILEQRYLNQQVINRWNYLASGTPASVTFAFALVSAMGAIPAAGVYPAGGMMNHIRGLQDSGVTFELISARDVYSNVDFYSTTFVPALTGSKAEAGIGVAAAFGFRTNRTRLDIRRGTKRFVGVTAPQIGTDGQYVAATVTQMGIVAADMSATLTYDDEGNTLEFQPVVVGREKYIPDPEKPDRVAYRYYPTFAQQDDHLMTSITWDIYTSVRTQVSRQIGHGR